MGAGMSRWFHARSMEEAVARRAAGRFIYRIYLQAEYPPPTTDHKQARDEWLHLNWDLQDRGQAEVEAWWIGPHTEEPSHA
jgi:hypothetical protein